MSGSGLFSIARSALLTHQTALQTISHNIANAETPGYSRQEAVLAANTPVRLSYGNVEFQSYGSAGPRRPPPRPHSRARGRYVMKGKSPKWEQGFIL